MSEGINLVKVRGEAMQVTDCLLLLPHAAPDQAASEMTPSGLMTVFVGADQQLGFGCEVAMEWARRHHGLESPVCQVGSYLLSTAPPPNRSNSLLLLFPRPLIPCSYFLLPR